jgi:small subunit ribosomal protein S19e
VYLNPGIGVGALALKFGGAKRGTARPGHVRLGSRKILREILSQLESNGFVETKVVGEGADGESATKGRLLTDKGRRELDRIARAVFQKKYASTD